MKKEKKESLISRILWGVLLGVLSALEKLESQIDEPFATTKLIALILFFAFAVVFIAVKAPLGFFVLGVIALVVAPLTLTRPAPYRTYKNIYTNPGEGTFRKNYFNQKD